MLIELRPRVIHNHTEFTIFASPFASKKLKFSDHEALRFLNSQKKTGSRHAKCVEYIEEYFCPQIVWGIENKVASV